MAPNRGRGGARGRGAPRRGRGGRGGRGAANPASRQKRGFTAARLDDAEDAARSPRNAAAEGTIASDDDVLDTASDVSGHPSDGPDGEEPPAAHVYQALLKTYHAQHAPKGQPPRKRRRMDDAQSPLHHGEDSRSLEESDGDSDAEAFLGGAVAQHTLALPDHQTQDDDDDEDEDDDGESHELDEFANHFASPDSSELQVRLQAIADKQWSTEKMDTMTGGRCMLQMPGAEHHAAKRRRIASIKDVHLKPRLVPHAHSMLGAFSTEEQAIAPSIFGYQDVLFGARTVRNAARLRHMSCVHALNHVFKTRDRVIKNNAKLSAQAHDEDAEYRDQGFTRPKVLFLLETKQACVRAVDAITQLCDFEQQENRKRFLDSFSAPEDKFSDDRPADFRELFEGNDENEFRIGLKFTRKTLKLYSKFYNSDIIFASPLGLRRAIESGGDKNKKDYDFLSSIELAVMEQADAALMQNWEHVEYVFEHLNLQPKDAHGCDFSRVRNWYLDGHAASLRQTIVLSAYLTPKINTLFTKHMNNIAGRLRFSPNYSGGTIETLNHGIKQTFSRFASPSHTADPDVRFKYFSATILPQIIRLPKPLEGGLGILIFIPSYLDFVRVRNSLVDSDFSYASISEYTDATDVRKARSHFMSGRHSVLLYTGRAHHFHRYNIRGVKRVVLYGLPENSLFYGEIVEFIAKSIARAEVDRRETSVRVAFSKWERLELERIVGSKRVGRMIADVGDTFDFV